MKGTRMSLRSLEESRYYILAKNHQPLTAITAGDPGYKRTGKNWRRVNGIPVIVTFKFSLFFSPHEFYISIAHPRGHLMFGTAGGLVA